MARPRADPLSLGRHTDLLPGSQTWLTGTITGNGGLGTAGPHPAVSLEGQAPFHH